jgi:hypothetical protein
VILTKLIEATRGAGNALLKRIQVEVRLGF